MCTVVGYKTVTARKPHRCSLCGGVIFPNEKYHRWLNIDMGSVIETKVHEKCNYIISAYCCDEHENKWQDDWIQEWLRDSLEPNIDCSNMCFEDLVDAYLRLKDE